jgi:hypothetical protein
LNLTVIGYSLLRATLGINIFLHGVSRVLPVPATSRPAWL